MKILHSFVFTFWYGTMLYLTFIQAPLLFKTLPRQLFGEVQSHLFPAYYWISYLCGALLVITFHLLHPLKNYLPEDCVKITLLCLMLAFSLVQGLWIGPKTGRLRLEIQALRQETSQTPGPSPEPGKLEELTGAFGKAHMVSSLVNLFVIIGGTWYFILLIKEAGPKV